ncbi:MAG: site-specific tyrosine recombinase [Acidimicrobiia bacterium]
MKLDEARDEYAVWLSVERGLAANSLAAYRRDLDRYCTWLSRHHVATIGEIDATRVVAYVQWLRAARSEDGTPQFAAASIARATAAIRGWHRFLSAEGHAVDPTANIEAPRVPGGFPKALTEPEIESLIDSIVGDDAGTIRDRAMMETMYAAGLRISELTALDVRDLDLDASVLRVFGKGSKERVVPIGRRARGAIVEYLERGRPRLHGKVRATDAVFLNTRGGRLTRQGCYTIIVKYGDRVGLHGRLSPHVLRHSCATHMLEHGADIRIVQELLGHASISTTQVYTKVSPDRLRSVYDQAHPRSGR